jgi:polysaccharide export outer membrane protein
MNLFFRGFFACVWLVACIVFTGCSSPSKAPVPHPRDAAVARFRIGETVIVAFSGSPIQIDAHNEPIKEDGTITLPLIGPVYAVGKTSGELQNEIYTNYVPKYYVRLTVTVRSGDRVYYVGGEVGHAGIFQYVSDTTVTKAIQSAGGLNDFASHGKIWLTRATTGQRIRVNYDDALQNPAKDPPVYPDDQINVVKRIF